MQAELNSRGPEGEKESERETSKERESARERKKEKERERQGESERETKRKKRKERERKRKRKRAARAGPEPGCGRRVGCWATTLRTSALSGGKLSRMGRRRAVEPKRGTLHYTTKRGGGLHCITKSLG